MVYTLPFCIHARTRAPRARRTILCTGTQTHTHTLSRRIECGTVRSTRLSRDVTPTVFIITSTSASLGPMCRRANCEGGGGSRGGGGGGEGGEGKARCTIYTRGIHCVRSSWWVGQTGRGAFVRDQRRRACMPTTKNVYGTEQTRR